MKKILFSMSLLLVLIGCDGQVTDRDGNTYKTVKIGNHVWMAENLRVNVGENWCYKGLTENCEKFGRLYAWDAAMEACPVGWHLPSQSEWYTLFSAVGGKETAGQMLKSDSGWNDFKGKNCNGSDSFSFSAIPAGYKYESGDWVHYSSERNSAYFWSSTEDGYHLAYCMSLICTNTPSLTPDKKGNGYSVRCIKD